MSEYNIQMNKYNALNAGYDQLYPQPMKHANTHAKDGSDPITPASIGAYSKTETDALLQNKRNWRGGLVSSTSVLEWAAAQSIPTECSCDTNTSGLPYSGYWMVQLSIYPEGGWRMLKATNILNDDVYIIKQNAGTWDTEWTRLATATDLDTKVSKSGGTMTGELNIKANNAFMNFISWFDANFGNKNAAITSYQSEDTSNADASRITLNNGGAYYQRCENGVWVQTFPLLNSGNAQTLGFSKIATGSYVGTGAAGQGQLTATVLTFNFAPKFLILVQDEGALPDGTTLLSKVGAYSIYGYNGFYHFYTYSSGFACKLLGWGTNTLSYYTNGADATYQFNASGKTYYYMALG